MKEKYLEIIKKSFPNALIKEYDDMSISHGWEICPDVRHILVFSINNSDNKHITIIHNKIGDNDNKTKVIYSGFAICDENDVIDENFMITFLRNYKCYV